MSRCMRNAGKTTASIDINMGKSDIHSSPDWKSDPYDLLTDSGFAFLC